MSALPAPDNNISVDVKDGMNDDIIKVLEKRFAEAVREAAPAAKEFKGNTRMDTAKKIWLWLKRDITYKRDPDGYQDIRMPRYFHYHKKGDCKSFTLNTLALWHNIYPNDKIYFFYAGYTPNADAPTHVYAKIKPADGQKEIIIDGCWYFLNSEKNYTFGKYSPAMQVRTLSDDLVTASQGKARPVIDIDRIYRDMSPSEKKKLENCMSDYVQLRLLELAKDKGIKSDEEVRDAMEGIEAKHKKPHHKKKGGKGKKALHFFNMTNPVLLLGRSCFLLAVSLNFNGLANKLGKLYDWGHLNHVMDFWYIIGGNPKKFLKIIRHSAKKKKFFLSKKAKVRYEQRYGPLSPNEVAYEKGVHGEIGIAPAVAAAVIGMIPVLAGIIPKMIAGFRAAAPQHPEALREANGLSSEGHDLIDSVSRNGYNLTSDDIAAFGGPGGSAVDEHGNVLRVGKDGKAYKLPGFKFGNTNFTFDWHNLKVISGLGDDGDGADTSTEDDTPAPQDSGPSAPAQSQSDAQLAKTLETLASAGMQTASQVMSQSQNPKVRQWGNVIGVTDSALTGKALQSAGYHDEANFHTKLHNAGNVINLFPIALTGAVLVGGYELLKPKPKAVSGFVDEHPWLTLFLAGTGIVAAVEVIQPKLFMNKLHHKESAEAILKAQQNQDVDDVVNLTA